MKPNTKYLKEVEERIAKMTDDKARSYLRGALAVEGNQATTKRLKKMLEGLK